MGEGGYSAWRAHVDSSPNLRAQEDLQRAVDAKRESDQHVACVKENLDPWTSSFKQLESIIAAGWQICEDAETHSSQLFSNECVAELAHEDSLQMMLRCALAKKPEQRGHWDKVAIDELVVRFDKKVAALGEEFESASALAAKVDAELESAREVWKTFKVVPARSANDLGEANKHQDGETCDDTLGDFAPDDQETSQDVPPQADLGTSQDVSQQTGYNEECDSVELDAEPAVVQTENIDSETVEA